MVLPGFLFLLPGAFLAVSVVRMHSSGPELQGPVRTLSIDTLLVCGYKYTINWCHLRTSDQHLQKVVNSLSHHCTERKITHSSCCISLGGRHRYPVGRRPSVVRCHLSSSAPGRLRLSLVLGLGWASPPLSPPPSASPALWCPCTVCKLLQ